LGCILDGGECRVGVESTVVNGLKWKEGGGGSVDVLRPGGLGVEDIARVVKEVDGREGATEIFLHGKPWRPNAEASNLTTHLTSTNAQMVDLPPPTPGMKYRHYSPGVPVYLLLPSNVFPCPGDSFNRAESSAQALMRTLGARHGHGSRRPRFGLLHYENSPLSQRLLDLGQAQSSPDIVPLSLGSDATSAAQRLFGGMLKLEGRKSDSSSINGFSNRDAARGGVDAILIEGCTDDGLGLAVMERVGKAVGGGGVKGELANGQVGNGGREGRFWVEV
jgi:L-threonylcarbamoyladenylate synthase